MHTMHDVISACLSLSHVLCVHACVCVYRGHTFVVTGRSWKMHRLSTRCGTQVMWSHALVRALLHCVVMWSHALVHTLLHCVVMWSHALDHALLHCVVMWSYALVHELLHCVGMWSHVSCAGMLLYSVVSTH